MSTIVGLEKRAMVEHLPGVTFNYERDQKLCETERSERSNHSVIRDIRFGCYCKHNVVPVLCFAKFTEFGFILLPWPLTDIKVA